LSSKLIKKWKDKGKKKRKDSPLQRTWGCLDSQKVNSNTKMLPNLVCIKPTFKTIKKANSTI